VINSPVFIREKENTADEGVIHGRLERKWTERRLLARFLSLASKQLPRDKRVFSVNGIRRRGYDVVRMIASDQDCFRFPGGEIRAFVTHIIYAR